MLTLGPTIIISPFCPSSTSFPSESNIFTTDFFIGYPIGILSDSFIAPLSISFIDIATVASVGPYPFIIRVFGNLFKSSSHNGLGRTSPINTIAFKLGNIFALKLSSTTHIPANEGVDTQKLIFDSTIFSNIFFKFDNVFFEKPYNVFP